MLESIFYFVIWTFIPTVLILTLWATASIAGNLEDKKKQKTTTAGFWGGFMLFILIMLYQISDFITTGFPNYEIFRGFNLWLALTGIVVGFIAFAAGRKILPPSSAGWIILIITSASFYSLLHYLFIRTYNEIILSVISGLTFGVFAFFASSPATIKEFLKTQSLD